MKSDDEVDGERDEREIRRERRQKINDGLIKGYGGDATLLLLLLS